MQLSAQQHGFLPRRSVVSNLMEFSLDISAELDNGGRVDVIYMDFAKAFDKGCYRSGKSGEKNRTGNQEKVRESGLKSGKSQGISMLVREKYKIPYTNKLTAAAPSPSLQTTRRMKQAAKNPGDCVEKSQGKMKNLVWKSGKSQGISL
ncbi:hypothetical protein J6590_078996 [Homalodisca vitripennis]|nr:hypothetical protein J6590_078996 [Homalodisca vitripennis]